MALSKETQEMRIGSDITEPELARNSAMKSVRSLGNDLNFAAKVMGSQILS